MEDNKQKELLIMTIIALLLLVFVAFIYIITNNIEENISKRAYIHQVYSSDYDLNFIDKNYIYATYNNKLRVILDNNGKEVYKCNDNISIDGVYLLKESTYLIYKIDNNKLVTYIFDGNNMNSYYTINDIKNVKPILDKANHLLAFMEEKDNDLYIYKLDNSGISVIKNSSYVSNYNNKLVIKKDDHLGIVDFDGKELIKPIYKDIIIDSNGNYIVKNDKNKYGLLSDNDTLFKFNYNYIYEENGYYILVNKKNKMSLYDNNYKIIIDNLNYNNSSNIKLFKYNNCIILVNNYNSYLDLKYNNIYIIKDGKLIDNIKNKLFNIDDYIYSYDNNGIYFYNEELLEVNSLELENSYIKVINRLSNLNKEIIYFKDDKEIKVVYNNDNNVVDIDLGIKVLETSLYQVFIKDDELYLYDLNGKLLDNIKGKKIVNYDNYIIVDNALYEIKDRL